MEKRERDEKRMMKAWTHTFGIVIAAAAVPATLLLGALGGMQKVIEAPSFALGTTINGIDISRLSLEEGGDLVLASENSRLNDISIKLIYNGAEASFGAKELGVSGNSNQILETAYMRNKTGAFGDDFDRSLQPLSMQSNISICDAQLEECIGSFLESNNLSATNAIAAFDAQSQTFTYTAAKNGLTANADAVFQLVKSKILEKNYEPLKLTEDLIQTEYPKVTEAMLRKNTVLISNCTTLASMNNNRNTNIRLMCEAVNGIVLMPGEILSLNELVGKRTLEKGFQPAPSIVDGQLVDDIGGGICQLAGTLYTAALYADMEIVERVHHTWPSEYLPVGLDATLNWNNKDLKIKNRSDYPVYIAATFENLAVDVNIYGQEPSDGIEIDLENVIVQEIEAPKAEIIYTDALPAGEVRTKASSRKGYEVIVYRHYLKEGEIVASDLISHDHFRPVRGTILKGTDEIIK